MRSLQCWDVLSTKGISNLQSLATSPRRCFPLTQFWPDPPGDATREELFLHLSEEGLQPDTTVPQRFPDVAETLVRWMGKFWVGGLGFRGI